MSARVDCPCCHGMGQLYYADEFPGAAGYLDCGRCEGTGEVPSCAGGCLEPAEPGGTHCVWCADDPIPAPPALPREMRETVRPARAAS